MSNAELLTKYEDRIMSDPFFAKSTKSSYLSDVRYFIKYLGNHSVLSVTPDEINLLVRHMVANRRSTFGIHRMIVSVRNFYKFLKAEGYTALNPTKEFTAQRVNSLIG